MDAEKKQTEGRFTEAVELLKETNRGQKQEADPEILQENIKGESKNLTIETFKYDFEKFYARFDKTLRHLETFGVKMKDDYVLQAFANECYRYRDLKGRAELVHLETHDNYHEIKIADSTIMDSKPPDNGINREFTA